MFIERPISKTHYSNTRGSVHVALNFINKHVVCLYYFHNIILMADIERPGVLKKMS